MRPMPSERFVHDLRRGYGSEEGVGFGRKTAVSNDETCRVDEEVDYDALPARKVNKNALSTLSAPRKKKQLSRHLVG